jgi:acylpyruvate hydrolase
MIYAIGRNYASHAKELGNAVPKGSPIVFFKPHGTIVASGQTVKLPEFSKNVHYEAELAFKFGPNLEVTDVAIANDLTARDKQKETQETKSPWGLAKGFKQSCGLGDWIAVRDLERRGVAVSELELRMLLNDRVVQHGWTKDMLFDVPTLVKYLRANFPVEPGDICLTGTPEGVGPVVHGDRLQAELIARGEVISTGRWNFV